MAGRYRLLTPLGAGGMGTVWRAEDVVLGREVAVKEVLFPRGLSHEDREVLRERTRREARAAARLDHPSAVTVFDVVEEDGSPFLVMELVEARTLSQVVRADGPLTPQRTAQVGLGLLGALETAHRQGIVHRDVKPGNVLLRTDGRVVLTDFGIASSPGDSSITSTGLLLGSPSYIAPERARGQSPGPASDLWSLGATLFTAVEGRPPYDGGEPLLTVTAVVTGDHEPFVAAGPLVPVLEGLLERDPERRLTAAQARAALEPIALSDRLGALPVPSPAAEVRAERTAAMDLAEIREQVAVADDAPVRVPVLLRDEPTWSQQVYEDRPRRSRAPLAALALVLVTGAGVAGYVVTDRGPTAGISPTVDASPTPAAPAPLPAGWTEYTDPEQGWSIGVPPSFDQTVRDDGQVQLRDSTARRTLRLQHDARPDQDALTAFRQFSGQLATALDRYREVRLEAVDSSGRDAAELEFTYTDTRSSAQLHVLDRRTTAPDGAQAIALYWQVSERQYAASLAQFEQIAATFRFGA